MGKKYIISDTHIGEREKIDDFKNKAENFYQLLKLIIKENPDKNDPGELVLLGDFFDFLEVEIKGKTSQNVESEIKMKIDKIDEKYPSLFKNMGDYLMKGQKIFYVSGNHDYHMLFPKVYRLVGEKLSSYGADHAINQQLFLVSDYYVSLTHKIYAEHGHRFDSENWHFNGMKESFGSLLVRNFLIHWEKEYKFLDNIRPRGNIFYLIQKECEKDPKKDQYDEIIKILKSMNDVQNEYLKMCDDAEFKNKKIESRRDKISALLYVFKKSSDWLDRVLLKLAGGSIVRNLNENCVIYRKKAEKLMNMENEDNISNQRDLDFRPEHFILGHTHFFDHKSLYNETNYYNTASWLDTLFYNEKGDQVVSTDDKIAKAPVLVFTKGEKKPVLYDISDTGVMTSKKFSDIAKEYIKHGVKY